MKSFSKYLICFFVVAALALCIGVPQVKADALLFPYFQSGGGAYTFISVQEWRTFALPAPATKNVHATYYYDFLSTPLVNECIHSDSFGRITSQDLMQYEVTKQVDSAAAPLSDASLPPYLNLNVPVQGFMIFDDANGAFPSFEAALPGQAVVIDTNTGFVAAYKALNNFLSTNPNVWSFAAPSLFHPTSKLTWLMSNYVSPETNGVDTKWLVLPTGINMVIPAVNGRWNGRVNLTNGFGTVWDHDEVPQSSNWTLPVICFDFDVTRTDIMDLAGQNHTDGGGMWWEVAAVPLSTDAPINSIANLARGAMMTKLESTRVFGSQIWAASFENAWPNLPY